jgi:hypothetical protein
MEAFSHQSHWRGASGRNPVQHRGTAGILNGYLIVNEIQGKAAIRVGQTTGSITFVTYRYGEIAGS